MTAPGTMRYRVRHAADARDRAACLDLRRTVFPADRAAADPLDALFAHVLVEDGQGRVVCTFRHIVHPSGGDVHRGYCGGLYALDALARQPGPMIELGRFCIRPGPDAPDILRLAWGWLARLVDDSGAAMLFGCASFPGADPAAHRAALGHLYRRHRAPPDWRPGRRAGRIVELAPLAREGADAMAGMPPLLRSYLAMGGRAGDHAVIDAAMDTLHVFVGVPVAGIPPARARLLRALAGACDGH
ncbi:putative hemolysin [Oceaniovalibus guishaninsula JLT2003]|uniref:L-ornithine N(alpha)-acyltransferase n=1 Tax=Oceaniovalibus guishaninsula JLT2003 TaxID=1231392 RepID=K2HQE3_9RHOB|nr:GNAT family N-acyltransferase [Oceaniovalibus guishaninsula]EKE45034.1 putative hemolysin [Oceaniovalibus guishaninsula JLT2003]